MAKVSRILQLQQIFGATQQDIEIQRVERGLTASVFVQNNAVADDGFLTYLVIPNPDPNIVTRIHLTGTAGGDAIARLEEGSTFTDNGVLQTPVARNRRISTVFGTQVFLNPTLDVQGDILFNAFIPGGTKNDAVGGSTVDDLQWILDPTLSYHVVAQNVSGVAQPLALIMTWSEDQEFST